MKSLNQEKEEHYESEVRRNAHRLRMDVSVEGDSVYLSVNGSKDFLAKPFNTKQFWYETWLALSDKYGDFPQFIQTPGGRTK